MPLHLLGKKSWNVYNQDNIERVRRDEERARIAQQKEELEWRDNDAAERLRLLRGGSDKNDESTITAQVPRGQKRKNDAEVNDETSGRRHSNKRIEDGSDCLSHQQSPNTTTDPLDKISNMRFRDAAGRDAQTPWYSASKPDSSIDVAPVGRDVWGNEDKNRHVREQKRLDSSDPLLAMKKGVKQLRQVEKQRTEWRREREKDLNEVEELAKRERRRKRRKERHKQREERSQEQDCERRSRRTP